MIKSLGPVAAAEITGIDLAQTIDVAAFAAIEAAFDRSGVIVVRDQKITPAQQVAFARRFGEIEVNFNSGKYGLAVIPEIYRISNITKDDPRTGRKCFYVNRDDCTGIVGVPHEEAEALIVALSDHVIKPEFVYRHSWREGDIVIWDNCTVQHKAILDYDLPQRRLMNRLTIAGTVPV